MAVPTNFWDSTARQRDIRNALVRRALVDCLQEHGYTIAVRTFNNGDDTWSVDAVGPDDIWITINQETADGKRTGERITVVNTEPGTVPDRPRLGNSVSGGRPHSPATPGESGRQSDSD